MYIIIKFEVEALSTQHGNWMTMSCASNATCRFNWNVIYIDGRPHVEIHFKLLHVFDLHLLSIHPLELKTSSNFDYGKYYTSLGIVSKTLTNKV